MCLSVFPWSFRIPPYSIILSSLSFFSPLNLSLFVTIYRCFCMLKYLHKHWSPLCIHLPFFYLYCFIQAITLVANLTLYLCLPPFPSLSLSFSLFFVQSSLSSMRLRGLHHFKFTCFSWGEVAKDRLKEKDGRKRRSKEGERDQKQVEFPDGVIDARHRERVGVWQKREELLGWMFRGDHKSICVYSLWKKPMKESQKGISIEFINKASFDWCSEP